ncbi:MAG: trehalose-phosphatase [Acidobacteriaceae bacterium]
MKEETVLSDFFDALRRGPSSLLALDYDGTLAAFQTDRLRAHPYPGVVPLLASIQSCAKTRTVIVSGRPVAEVKALLYPIENVEMWGSHGMEKLSADGTYHPWKMCAANVQALQEAGEKVHHAGLGPRTEIKPGSVAVHWRDVSPTEAQEMESMVLAIWGPLLSHSGLMLMYFDGGLELRVAHPNKGDVMAQLLATVGPGAQVAYLGDDLTDEDAFRALKGRGLPVLVRPEYRQTGAEVWLRPPQEMLDFLKRWLNCVSV